MILGYCLIRMLLLTAVDSTTNLSLILIHGYFPVQTLVTFHQGVLIITTMLFHIQNSTGVNLRPLETILKSVGTMDMTTFLLVLASMGVMILLRGFMKR